MATVNEIVDALMARHGAVVKSVEDPMVIDIEQPMLQSRTSFSVFKDGRVSVAISELGGESVSASPELHAQYRVEHVKIRDNGTFEVSKPGWHSHE